MYYKTFYPNEKQNRNLQREVSVFSTKYGFYLPVKCVEHKV